MTRRSFMLLEVLIASFLVFLVVSASLSWFIFSLKASREQSQQLLISQKRCQAVSHIRSILRRISHTRGAPFTVEAIGKSQALIFSYNNGVDPNPQLSNEVLAMLHVDTNGLVLTIRSATERAAIGQETEESYVLWPGVETLSFSFLFVNTSPEGPTPYTWITEWQPEWTQIPTVVRLTIKEKKRTSTVTCLTKTKLNAIQISG